MISITCTNCRTLLEMDEAFAGGVCRCQFCGTIQTVPSHLKATATAAKSFGGTGKTGGRSVAATPSSGLDDLANAVSSSGLSNSGLSGSGLRSKVPTGPSRAAALQYQKPKQGGGGAKWALVAMAVVVLVLLGAVTYLFLGRSAAIVKSGAGGGSTPSGTASPGGGTPSGTASPDNAPPTASATSGPNFAGLGVVGGTSVVYVVDRGNSGERFFDATKFAVARSAESLGADKQFGVVFWRRSDDAGTPMTESAFPDAGLAKATGEQVSAFLAKSEGITAGGATTIDDAIAEAVKRNPSTIVIVTAKDDLNLEGTASAVDKARGSTGIKINAVTTGSGSSNVLKAIAAKAGGQYGMITEQTLKDQ